MQKTLGGDRLGSGNKMKVELHGYNRSTHDLGYIWRSTMSAGTLVPFLCEIGLPGDTFDINLGCDIKTHPTIGPLFGSYKVQLDVFMGPIRLYNAMLHNNSLYIGRDMSQVKLPLIKLTARKFDITKDVDLDNSQVNPSCLLAYLGIRGIGIQSIGVVGDAAERSFNATAILLYWEIFKNYYANKQEEIGAVIHTPNIGIVTTVDKVMVDANELLKSPDQTSLPLTNGTIIEIQFTGTTPIPSQILVNVTPGGIKTLEELAGPFQDNGVGSLIGAYNFTQLGDLTAITWRYTTATDPTPARPTVTTFPLGTIDQMKKLILAAWSGAAPFIINDHDVEPYIWLTETENGIPNIMNNQEGLAVKTYQSDLFNNWLKTENIEDITLASSVDTSGGSFSIDQLNLATKVYKMMNRINVGGGSYNDWLDAVYTHDRFIQAESPMYMGGLIKELIFQEVVSNSQSADQPLGTLAGKGIMSNKHKGGQVIVKVDEPCYIMGLISLTPRIDYSQGNKWDVHLKTVDDLHKPAMDGIGFQDLITEQMAWWDTEWNNVEWVQKSAGKQPAWINYMTNVNRTFGNFAIPNNEMFMTLNRRYEHDDDTTGITDLTTYIDPSKFNFIFAQTALDAQNFWAQIAVDMTVRRKLSAKIMPNL